MSFTHEALQLILENQVKALERDIYIQKVLHNIEKQICDLRKEIKEKKKE